MMRVLTALLVLAASEAATQPSIKTVDSAVEINGQEVVFNLADQTLKASEIVPMFEEMKSKFEMQIADMNKTFSDRIATLTSEANLREEKLLEMVQSLELELKAELNQTNSNLMDTNKELQETAETVKEEIGGQIEMIQDSLDELNNTNKDGVTCGADNEGHTRVNGGYLEVCHEKAWKPSYHEPLGNLPGAPATSCREIYDDGSLKTGTHMYYFSAGEEGHETIYQGLCTYQGSEASIVFHGGDGTSATETADSCATLKTHWKKADGVYYVARDADDMDTSRRVHCKDGKEVAVDGSSEENVAKDCASLVDDFEAPIYDEDGSPKHFWLPQDEKLNMALDREHGVVAARFSSMYFNRYSAEEAIDGNRGDMAHGVGGNGEINPFLEIEFEAEVEVTKIILVNRGGTCGVRTFDATTGCMNYVNKDFKGTNQGAVFRVSDEPCHETGDKSCPGTICKTLTRSTSSIVYTITCDKPIIGRYVSMQLPSGPQNSLRLMNIQELEVYGKKRQTTCIQAATNDGTTKEKAGVTCRSIKKAFPKSTSKGYWIKPDPDMDAFQVYCEMTEWGGGWTLVENIGSNLNNFGHTNGVMGASYLNLGFKPEELIKRGVAFNKYQSTESFSLGKQRVNAVWRAHGNSTLIRWRQSRTAYQGGCADHVLQKLNAPRNWDLFHALRDTREWSPEIRGDMVWSTVGNADTAGSEMFRINSDYNCPTTANFPDWFNPTTGHMSKPYRSSYGTFMRWWDSRIVRGQDSIERPVSRHGIIGDNHGGCQWLFQFSSTWSQTSCRSDITNYILLR